ncbi:hypothetical protein ACERII_05925 [Evansella sp. AB-rgal1]|uniref:hypothetical protein n=1 Tax=Evansella sp. AB-rgal1 TaxID=3242696 RepID=UPI00359F061B
MENIANKLRKYIKGQPEIKIIAGEYDTSIVDAHTEEWYGEVHFQEDGSLQGFDIELYNEDEAVPDTTPPLPEDKIALFLHKAEQFVNDFVTSEVEFGMFSEWINGNYIIIYEEIDGKLGIPIPHTGCTLYMNQNGDITSAQLGKKEYTLEYPDLQISKEEAKEILRNESIIELAILAEENKTVELVYRVNPAITGVKVDGTIDNVLEFMDVEELPVHSLEKTVCEESLEKMLGITEEFVMFKDDGESKLWVEKETLDNVDPEEEIHHKVSFFEDATGQFIASDVNWEKTESTLVHEELQVRATKFLELMVGNIHEKYWLEQPQQNDAALYEADEELEEVDTQEDDDYDYPYHPPEPTQLFTFIRQHKGMKIEGFDAIVHVGMYTGLIRECSTTKVNESQLKSLRIVPTISLEEAEKRYFDEMKMMLIRSVKNFDDTSIYDLTYTMNFPGKHGTIEKISAHTGEVTYVETGIIKEG